MNNSTIEKKTNSSIMQWFKTFVPIAVLGVLLELIAYFAWIGPKPSSFKWGVIFATPFFVLALVCAIKPIRLFFAFFEELLFTKAKNTFSTITKRHIIVALCDVVLSLALGVIGCIVCGGITTNRLLIYFCLAFSIVSIISCFVFFRNVIVAKIEIVVFIAIITVGTAMISILPASCGEVWDDQIHFQYAVSTSHLLDGRLSEADYLIIGQTYVQSAEGIFFSRTEEAVSNWNDQLDQVYTNGNITTINRIFPLYFISYMPSALGLSLGRALFLPYHITFQLGRWFNLLFYSAVLYFGIKKLKSGKLLVSTIALLPSCMMMATTYSRDAWMISLSIYGICYFVSELQQPDKKMAWNDMLLMVGSLFLGVLPKQVYALLLMILLFVPFSKFRSRKTAVLFKGIVVLLTLYAFYTILGPMVSSSGAAFEDTRGGAEVSSGSQISYIIHNPFAYAKTLIVFLMDYISLSSAKINLDFYAYFGVGRFGALLISMLAYCSIFDHSELDNNIKIGTVIWTVLLGCASLALVATSMYIAFTPYQATTILGCQYRYMLELFFPALFFIGKIFRFRGWKKQNVIYLSNALIVALSMMVILVDFYLLYLRYY